MALAMIDIGNTFAKVALYDQDKLCDVIRLKTANDLGKQVSESLQILPIERVFISSVNTQGQAIIEDFLKAKQLPYDRINKNNLALSHDVEDFNEMGDDRICNLYGALHFFPMHDCLVIDIGTTITFDLIAKQGTYKGGAIFAGRRLVAEALHFGTSLLPKVVAEPKTVALGKTTNMQLQSGIYYGLLGAIERIAFELCQGTASTSSVKIVATGGETLGTSTEFYKDLQEITDFIAPHLTVEGLYAIYKEQIHYPKENQL